MTSPPSYFAFPGLQYPANDLDNHLSAICRVSGISESDMRSKTRRREVAVARQVFFYYARKNTGHSLKKIGEFIGGFDHATVLHSVNVVNNMLETKDRMITELVNKAKMYL